MPGVKITKAATVGTVLFVCLFFAIFICIVSCLLLIIIAAVLEWSMCI